MTTLSAGPTTTARLLAAASAGADHRAHLSVHGPLDLPARRPERWAQAVLAEVRASGLTGRGGAGFPTARKLELLAAQRRRPLVVVNAMEGEPASHKDGVLLTRAPHLVLDGAATTALVVGAEQVVVCVAGDRPDAAASLRRAIHERAAALPVEVRVERPPGRYLAGEESALVDWVAGGTGLPRFRLDKGSPLTARRAPVLLHNAETMAHVGLVARHGAAWFRRAGHPEAPGTTLVTLSGAVEQPGVFEVELGTPLGEVVALGGCTQAPAALLLGGYGGAFVPGSALDVAYANPALAPLGAAVGAGVVAVVPEGTCGVTETARVLAYLAGESAGQCGPCVHGLPALAEDMTRLARGEADGRLLERMARRFELVEGRGACRLPDGAVRLARSALAVFADDARAHAQRRPCPGSSRRALLPVPARPHAGVG